MSSINNDIVQWNLILRTDAGLIVRVGSSFIASSYRFNVANKKCNACESRGLLQICFS